MRRIIPWLLLPLLLCVAGSASGFLFYRGGSGSTGSGPPPVTLNSISLSSSSFTYSAAGGTQIGTVSVNTTPSSSFTGTVSLTASGGAGHFALVNPSTGSPTSNLPAALACPATPSTCPASGGPFSDFQIVATQAGATGSPLSYTPTITGSSPPPITLNSVALSGFSFTYGAAGGTQIGTVTVNTTPSSSFTGTLSLSPTSGGAGGFVLINPSTGLATSSLPAALACPLTPSTCPSTGSPFHDFSIVATQTGATGSPVSLAPTITGSGGGPCVFNGSVAPSCIPSSDTTHQFTGSEPNTAGVLDSLKFDPGGGGLAGLAGGGGILTGGCLATYVGPPTFNAGGNCGLTSQVQLCTTPGGSPTWRPSIGEGIVSWQAPPVAYNTQGQNVLNPGVPYFTPTLTFAATNSSIPRWDSYYVALMSGGVCSASTNSYFTDSVLGQMPNLFEATRAMTTTGETLTVSPPPAGVPYWPGGENLIGPKADSLNPPSHLTLNLTGASFGYATVSKGLFDVENNATTINGGTCFWVNPSDNLACIAIDAGLDLTVSNFRGEASGMGIDRNTVRQGIINITNVLLEDMGCNLSCRQPGSDHPLYLNRVDASGFDTVIGTNVATPDVIGLGWNVKLRPQNTQLTQSFFGARVNNGASSAHGTMDYPCGGTHSVTYSTIENNQYSMNRYVSGQTSTLVAIGEEWFPNAVTVPPSSGFAGGFWLGLSGTTNCPQNVGFPTAAPFTATIINPNQFTTTTNPATFFPINFSAYFPAGFQYLWDLGASGTMLGGPAQIFQWTGPVGGLYTVTFTTNNSAEGTLPLQFPAATRYSAFAASSGTVTLYPMNGAATLLTNTPTTASWQVPVDPRIVGIAVNDTIYETDNTLTVTGISGSGPYTITASCANPAYGSTNCLVVPEGNVSGGGAIVASGTYNSSTGAVSLQIGTDIGLTNGTAINVSGLYATGAGAGNVGNLDGAYTAQAGTGGTTVNYTAPAGQGTMTIGTTNTSTVSGPTSGLPPNLNWAVKVGPSQITASTTGTGCDGTNTLCGIAYSPIGMQLSHGRQVVGTGVPNTCVVAGKIAWIWPVMGSSGTGYSVGQTVTLAGGTFEQAAVYTIDSVSGGAITGGHISTGGVYTSFVTAAADHKTFTQASTSGSGTGAQFEFPYPQMIQGGSSGNYTLRLAQPSGANCVSSAVTGQVYQVMQPISVTWDHDLIGWDGACTNGNCAVLWTPQQQPAWMPEVVTNSILWTNKIVPGPSWNVTGQGGILTLGMTDGGGNILCNDRTDLATSPRCAVPEMVTSNFVGGLSGTTLTVGCNTGSSCMTITSGSYNSTSGVVTLTVSNPNQIVFGVSGCTIGSTHCDSWQGSFTVSGLTGSGTNLSSLNGNWYAISGTTGTTLMYQMPTGLGSISITGGNINPASGAAACKPGMFVWDNQGIYNPGPGAQGMMLAGTSITSGTSPTFTVYIPPGGSTTTDVPAGTAMTCGWGTPSSAFNGTINGSGVLTVNSGLVGSIHVGDYLADVSSTLPANVRVSSGSGTTWQTTYSGAGVAAEYMVSVRSDAP